jgi:hypothetical protein
MNLLDLARSALPSVPASSPGCAQPVAEAPDTELFDFALLTDPDSDQEALEERAAIVAEGCGVAPTQALREARWQAEREQTWRAFLRNARRILDAPAGQRRALLERYHAEAAAHYGEPTAGFMVGTMRRLVAARASDAAKKIIRVAQAAGSAVFP